MPRLRPDNTLVMVIDMQERLQPLIADDARVRKQAAALAEGARLLGVPVFVTEQYPKGLGHTVPELRSAVDAAGGVYEKSSFSCAADESIAARITAAARPNVVLAGVEAHICVLQTALDLTEAGYSVFLAEDAVGSRTKENKEIGIARARRHGAEPANVEMVLFELMGTKEHPQFKAVQALIK
ncbi:MAG TPA: hydrolase [Candidatus Thermoplasmatota archaeon]|nr:hydrolase [Candidatus Thermoplasmatota archaeon]